MPSSWDVRTTLNPNGDDSTRIPVPIRVELKFPGIRPIRAAVAWIAVRGEFAFSIPVAYPAGVDHGDVIFRRDQSQALVGRWTARNLPSTKNTLAGIKLAGSFTTSRGITVQAAACRHRGLDVQDEPDEIVVGASLAGVGTGAAHLKRIRICLPFACENGGLSSSSMSIDGARKLMVALPTPYADETQSIRLEATVVEAKSIARTLHVGKVLLQNSARGWTVAGRRWTTQVEEFSVSVSDVFADGRKTAKNMIRLKVDLQPVKETGPWFEVETSNHSYASKGESVEIELPKPDGVREVELDLRGRVVTPGAETQVRLNVPVQGKFLPKTYPSYRSGLSVEPYLEGSLGGFTSSG